MLRLAIPIRGLGAGLILAIIATACGQPAAPSPAATQPAAPATQPAAAATKPAAAPATQPTAAATKPAAAAPAQSIKVRLGVVGSTSDAGFFIALDKGYFKEQGLDIEATSFGSAAQMVAPLGAGQLDIGGGSPGAGLWNAVARDINIKIVADKGRTSKGGGFQGMVVRKDLWDSGEVKSYADLKGRKVAINSLAGIAGEPILDKAMRERANGLGARDTDLVALNFPDMPAALANKSVDAAIIIEPFLTKVVQDKLATVLAREDDIYPEHQVAVVLYAARFAKENPDAGKRFMVAYIKALRDYNDAFVKKDAAKYKEIVGILTKNTTLKDAALYEQVVMPGLNPNGEVNADSLSWDQNYFVETGTQKEKVNMADVVDPSFVKAAVQQLGPYK